MKVNLIIGAGQLGSRHLQGLLKYDRPQQIFVLDPLLTSLEIAAQRAKEIKHKHKIYFTTDWKDLPYSFDLVIVATNSDVREKVINLLITNYQVSYLILEKVLFQEIEAYRRIKDLINKYHIKTWVNHPRRMLDSYNLLKSKLKIGSRKTIQVTGGNWGLGCNALHFLDIFVFLSDSKLTSVDAAWIDNEIHPSKRKGFVEFTGSIKGLLEDNSTFQITSLKGEASICTITVFDAENRFIIQESGTPQIYHLKKEISFRPELIPFNMELQSSLTTHLATNLFEKGTCILPLFEDACHTHELFINALMIKYKEITGSENNILPIT